MCIPSKEQTASTSLQQSSYADSLTLMALIRTASGTEGGRNIATEVNCTVVCNMNTKADRHIAVFLFLFFSVLLYVHRNHQAY